MILLFSLIWLCKKIKAGEESVHMSFRTRRWHIPSRNHEPSWGKLWFARILHQSLSQFGQKNYHSMLVPCHDTMPSFMIFRRVLDLHELKKPSFSIFPAEPRRPDVWISFPFLAWDLEIHSRTHMWFFKQLWCSGACACSSNSNYANEMRRNSINAKKGQTNPE